MTAPTTPWYVRLLLVRPGRVLANLERVRAAGFDEVPTPWQLSLAVLRMWHRLAFRSDTVGTCSAGRPRPTWRARLLKYRPLRLPFLLAEGAVVPLDLTGLASDPERVIRHLLGAHHDHDQFAFDLEILALYDQLPRLEREVRQLLAHDTPRSRWLRDLTVFEGYHESLLAAVERARAGQPVLEPDRASDPDLSFVACLRWCARQPDTPRATLRAYLDGRFRLDGPLAPAVPA